MPSSAAVVGLTFRGTDVQRADNTLFLEVEEGLLDGGLELRGSDTTVPGRAGRRERNRIPDSLPIVLKGWVRGDGSGSAAWSSYYAAWADLQELLRPTAGSGLLVATLPDATVLTANARPVDIMPGALLRAAREVSVELEAVDPPYWVGADVTAGADIAASPTDIAITNPGTERGDRFLIDIEGPIANPRITNVATGVYLEALVTVGAGLHLVIDTRTFAVLNDGVSSVGSLRHSGLLSWLALEPGANTLRVTGTGLGAGTHVDVTFEPPYL